MNHTIIGTRPIEIHKINIALEWNVEIITELKSQFQLFTFQ